MRSLVLACAVATAGLCVPTSALATAALPKTKTKRIVFGRSIGGVTIGQTKAQAQAAWGGKGDCSTSADGYTGCGYGAIYTNGFATFTVNPPGAVFGDQAALGSAVFRIALNPPRRNDDMSPMFKGPLMKFKTARGIGLGSSSKALKKDYPKVKNDADLGYTLVSGDQQTIIGVSSGRVSSIAIGPKDPPAAGRTSSGPAALERPTPRLLD